MAVLKPGLPLDDASGVGVSVFSSGLAGAVVDSGVGGAVVDAISEVGTGVEFKVTDGKVGVVVEAAGVAPIVLVRNNTSTTTPMMTRRANKQFPIQRARKKGRSCDSFASSVTGS